MKTKDFFKLESRVILNQNTPDTQKSFGTADPAFHLTSKRIRQLDDYSKRPHSFKKPPFTKLKCETGEKGKPLYFQHQTSMPIMPNARKTQGNQHASN